jgi:hypothetical protein
MRSGGIVLMGQRASLKMPKDIRRGNDAKTSIHIKRPRTNLPAIYEVLPALDFTQQNQGWQNVPE